MNNKLEFNEEQWAQLAKEVTELLGNRLSKLPKIFRKILLARTRCLLNESGVMVEEYPVAMLVAYTISSSLKDHLGKMAFENGDINIKEFLELLKC